jgi:hypothetical protein
MKRIFTLTLAALLGIAAFAQTQTIYQFTPVNDIKVTPVKNQARTGTCWCFATVSFLEAELLRQGKGEYDLSEMFVVRNNYTDRIFDNYLREDTIRMFERMGVMNAKELAARNEVKWETYTKKIQIEARVMGDLSMNHIIPIATQYQSQLAKNVLNMYEIFSKEEADQLTARNKGIIKEIAERTQAIETGVEELVNARKVANKIVSEREKAIAYHDTVEPKMEEIRYEIDKLELIVSDECWTLPKYRELLFIR